jgi:ADP-ribosylglycohydrolase
VADVAATGADLRSEAALDAIARRFADWYAGGPPDVGVQTAAVLGAAGPAPTAATMAAAAEQHHERTGRSGGNGSIMRTSAVALAHLGDAAAIVEAASAVSRLTHTDARAAEACVLWCLAIDHAVRTGELNARAGLARLPADARLFWQDRLDEAEQRPPSAFNPNGYVVPALQAAWSAIHHTAVPQRFPCRHLADALDACVRIGHDTDTVASIAGALLGARWGASAIPAEWRMRLHGWPGGTSDQLADLAALTVNGGADEQGWPGCGRIAYEQPGHDSFARHPHDDGVYLSGAGALDQMPEEVTTVLSLCRIGSSQVPAGVRAISFRLIDKGDEDNPNLDFVIDDAARTVRRLREDGERVLLHCVAAQSRTPTVATWYSVLCGVPFERALHDVCTALPAASPNPAFRAALRRLAGDYRKAGAC